MQNFFGIEVDTANMTLEELVEARKKTLEILTSLDLQLFLRRKASHKYSSCQYDPAKV